jgi:methylmalonyl-CoA mutase C-terminal domain/subunit
MKRKLRILLARFGDGYEGAMLKLAGSCSEAGFEVVYTDVADPKAIVASAVQEAVDHIGITTLPGAKVDDFRTLFELIAKEGIPEVRVTAGGFFPEQDTEKIKKMGVLDFYPRGSIYNKIAQWKKEYAEESGR